MADEKSNVPPIMKMVKLRLFALAVDVLVLAGAGAAGFLCVVPFVASCSGMGCMAWIAAPIAAALFFIAALFVQGHLLAARGCTFGMKKFGLLLKRADGAPAGFVRVFWLRNVPLAIFLFGTIVSTEVILRIHGSPDSHLGVLGIDSVRELAYIIAFGGLAVLLLLNAAGYLRKDGRTLQDVIAGTVITPAGDGGAAERQLP